MARRKSQLQKHEAEEDRRLVLLIQQEMKLDGINPTSNPGYIFTALTRVKEMLSWEHVAVNEEVAVSSTVLLGFVG